MASTHIIAGVEFTTAAAEFIAECGVSENDIVGDVTNIKNGDVAEYQLRARNLDGADEDRREGILDYVSAVVRAAGRENG